jgi:hypothetical protein
VINYKEKSPSFTQADVGKENDSDDPEKIRIVQGIVQIYKRNSDDNRSRNCENIIGNDEGIRQFHKNRRDD